MQFDNRFLLWYNLIVEKYLYQFKTVQKECDAFAQILSNPDFLNKKVRIFCDTELYKNYLLFVFKKFNVDFSLYTIQPNLDFYKLSWLDVLQYGINSQRLLKITSLDKLEVLSYYKNGINENIDREISYINSVISSVRFNDKKTEDEIKSIFAQFPFLGVQDISFTGLFSFDEFINLYRNMLLSSKTQVFNPEAHVQIFDYLDPILQEKYDFNILLGLVQYEYFEKVDLNSFIVLNDVQFSYYTEINNVATDILPIVESFNLTLIPEKKISGFIFKDNDFSNLNIINLNLKDTIGGKLSVTKLQDYSVCPFRFWANLLDKTRFPITNSVAQIGSACHFLINTVLKEIISGNINKNVSDEEIQQIISKASQTKEFEDFLLNPQNTITAINKSVETLKLTLSHLRETKYELFASELKIGENIGLNIKNPVLGDISITGIIDRVDKYDDGNKIYFNIIDYKSGSTSFATSELQLELYAASMQNFPGDVQISGMLLNKISAPIDDLDRDYQNKNKMVGVSLDETVKAMAPELDAPSATANYISVYTKKDGGFTKSSQIKTTEEINEMIASGLSKATEIIDRISFGNAKAHENQNCQKCPYNSICK